MIDLQESDIRIEKSSLLNKKWFYKFRQQMVENGDIGEGSCNNYLSTIRLLYESYNHQDIHVINLIDIQDFLSKWENPRTVNGKIAHLKSFFSFISQDGAHLSFKIDELTGYVVKKKELDNEEKRRAIPLTIKEIITLRQLLKKKEKYALWFTFEMIYQYGLKKKELIQLYKRNYDVQTRIFTVSKELTIQITEPLHDLVMNYNVIPEKKYHLSAYDYRITEIGMLIKNENLIHKDIYQTHKQNFLLCPLCKTPTENNPNLWAILEYEEDNSQWIVCRKCALEGTL